MTQTRQRPADIRRAASIIITSSSNSSGWR